MPHLDPSGRIWPLDEAGSTPWWLVVPTLMFLTYKVGCMIGYWLIYRVAQRRYHPKHDRVWTH
jgi:hypothetical protein